MTKMKSKKSKFTDTVRMNFLQHFKFQVMFDQTVMKWACVPYDHSMLDFNYSTAREAIDAAIIEGENL